MTKIIGLMLFLLAMFLIKLPSFYLSSATSKFLTSHVVAKIIIGIIFLYFLIDIKIRKKLNHKSIILPFIFLISQTLSILRAVDTVLFLKDYQNLIFFLLIIILGFIYGQRKKNASIIYKFILITGVFVVFLDFIYFLFSHQFIYFISIFIQKEMLPAYILNLERGRYNLYLNTELFLPFFITIFLISNNKLNKIYSLVAVSFITFSTIISNFRHRLLFLIFVLISFGYNFFQKRKKTYIKKYVTIFFAVFLLVTFSSLFIARTFFQKDIVNRLLFQNEFEDVSTINTRLNNFKNSMKLLSSSPVFGVGLGNYQLYQGNNKEFSVIDSMQRDFMVESRSDPHSIISKTAGESGIIGLLALGLMIIYFFRRDFLFIKEDGSYEVFAYIISFWGLFILSLITPSITIFRGGWMWFMRGLLEGQYQLLGVSRKSSKYN